LKAVQRAAIAQVGFQEGMYARSGGAVGIPAYLRNQKLAQLTGC